MCHFSIVKRLSTFGIIGWLFVPMVLLLVPMKLLTAWLNNARMDEVFQARGFRLTPIEPGARAEGFVFAAVADEGLLARADAGDLLRARRAMGAEHIAIFADIKKKHSSHAITADTSLDEHAKTAEFFGANGVIVTGTATGVAPPLADLASAQAATPLVVLAGSGVTSESVRATLATCDGVIVGSDLKVDGRWYNALDLHRVERLVRAARS